MDFHTGNVYMIALDFCRALNERGWFWNCLFRIAVGKYARNEYELMVAVLDYDGVGTKSEYGLEESAHHTKEGMAELKDIYKKERNE